MIRKKDLLILLTALVVAFAALGAVMLSRGGAGEAQEVLIYVDGALYARHPISEKGEIRIEQEDGSVNIVTITGEGVYMQYSTCDNQLCVQQGEVTEKNWIARALGRQIVCLPNHVLVEISQDSGPAAADVPDV